jgi:hypothetical protein
MATISNLAIDQYSDFATTVTVNAGAADTTLNGAITNSATTLTVNSTTEFPTAGTLVIEAEQITYTGTTSTTFTGCTRGANATTALAHVDNSKVSMNAAALNLTGYSAQAQLRKTYTSSTSTSFTSTITAATDGMIELALTDTVTGALDQGRYVWDLVITDAAANKTRVVEGIVTIRPGVSR